MRATIAAVLVLVTAALLAPAPVAAREEKAKAACLDEKTPSPERVTACTRYLRGGQPPLAEQVEILRARGRAYRDMRQFPEALADFDAAIAITPDTADLYRQRGLAYDWSGDRARALVDFDQAIALDPSDPWTHQARARTLSNLKRRDEALAAFNQSLALKPGYGAALEGRGDLYRVAEQWQPAYEDYLGVLPQDPYSAFLKVKTGYVAGKAGLPFEAFHYAAVALLLDPNNQNAYYALEALGVDRTRGAPLPMRPVEPGTPAAGISLQFLQQEIDPLSEVEIDPMEEAINDLVGWFSGPKTVPNPKWSLFVTRTVEQSDGNLARVVPSVTYPINKPGDVREPSGDFLWGLLPAALVTPQGSTALIQYGENLPKLWTLQPGESVSGDGQVVVPCPAAGVSPDFLQNVVGCKPERPGEAIRIGKMTWTATLVGWEAVLVPAGRITTLKLHYFETSELTLMGKTKKRDLDLTWWWDPDLDWWVKRRLARDGKIEVTQLLRLP